FLIAVFRAIHADSGRVNVVVRPAEGDHSTGLVTITAKETFLVIGMLRDCVRHLWRDLPCVFAFAHDPKLNYLHLYLLICAAPLIAAWVLTPEMETRLQPAPCNPRPRRYRRR